MVTLIEDTDLLRDGGLDLGEGCVKMGGHDGDKGGGVVRAG